jgi:hypothetical protein
MFQFMKVPLVTGMKGGRIKQTEVTRRKQRATNVTGRRQRPREYLTLLSYPSNAFFPRMNRRNVGIKYEIWRRTTEEPRMAFRAVVEPRSGVSGDLLATY